MFGFSQALNNKACIPTYAFDTSTGKKTPSANLYDWPNTGQGCRTPPTDKGNRAPAIPIYYTIQSCGDDKIYVGYHLFYEKDGFKLAGGTAGHP